MAMKKCPSIFGRFLPCCVETDQIPEESARLEGGAQNFDHGCEAVTFVAGQFVTLSAQGQ